MISRERIDLTGDEEGRLNRPFPTGEWLVPAQVELVNGRLEWDWFGEDSKLREIQPDRLSGLLEGFLSLADAKDKDILRYARQWGVLALCKHGLPTSHFSECRPLDWPGPCAEPLTAWRHYAKEANALVRLSLKLGRNTLPQKQDWSGLPLRRPPRSVEAGRLLVAERITRWLTHGGVRARLAWRQTRPTMSFGGGGLFGALAIQLMLAASRTSGVAICSGCGMGYLPSRQPRAKERHYCEECRRRKVPQRDAARDGRAFRRLSVSQSGREREDRRDEQGGGSHG